MYLRYLPRDPSNSGTGGYEAIPRLLNGMFDPACLFKEIAKPAGEAFPNV